MLCDLVAEEWTYDAYLIVDYEPEATVWDLFKFEYMKLYGNLPPDVEIDYPAEKELRSLAAMGLSPNAISKKLDMPQWLVTEALEYYKIPYCNVIVNAGGIVTAYLNGDNNRKVLAKRFGTTVYYVNKVLGLNGVK